MHFLARQYWSGVVYLLTLAINCTRTGGRGIEKAGYEDQGHCNAASSLLSENF